MDANEIAQRLMLVTNIRFKVDKDGNMIESDEPISDEIVKEALNMSDEVFKSRLENQRRNNILEIMRYDIGLRAAYKVYKISNPDIEFNVFARLVINEIEDSK